MKMLCLAALTLSLSAAVSVASETDTKLTCEKLVALYIELGKSSGQAVSKEAARAAVMSENPSDADCAAMLALFSKQK
ncbi:hypothetical protein K1718_10405 [Roseibium porphyridii]|uniref:Uncharacterized protein n=1 Tax=Roseibium porphyridii TaxID=2866279 RepID=A0ABY8F954_9HYPH|nr:hypothetical protein [Roseibium sp. KMA01]WFE91746.1 hypothetical protein K1718_10405 [Roseibium sp. KMA01]